MKERKEKKASKPPVALESQEKFGHGRDWSGFEGFRREYPTAPGGETWASFEKGLLAATNLNAARETIRYATLDRKAAFAPQEALERKRRFDARFVE